MTTDDFAPAVGDLVYDTVKRSVGTVMEAREGSAHLYLRRPGGGVEWQAARDSVRRPTASEELGPRVDEINKASRTGRA